jgi:hypothetical protein
MRSRRNVMPPIDLSILDCTVFLYPNKSAAASGAKFGGSGFLIAIPYQQEIAGQQRSHIYVVTNSHIVREHKSTFIRLNNMDGRHEVVPKTYQDWIDNWDKDDLALCMLDNTTMSNYGWLAPLPNSFLTKKHVYWGSGGIEVMFPRSVTFGSDVITVGRYVGFDGKQKNLPVIRFGNISMLPYEPIEHSRKGLKQESFLIESHTIGGYSGSPVFSIQPLEGSPLAAMTGTEWVFPDKLLGIVWGYSYVDTPVKRKIRGNYEDVGNNMIVPEHSGMSLVIPAWKLGEFLGRDDLVMQRKNIEEKEFEDAENRGGAALT